MFFPRIMVVEKVQLCRRRTLSTWNGGSILQQRQRAGLAASDRDLAAGASIKQNPRHATAVVIRDNQSYAHGRVSEVPTDWAALSFLGFPLLEERPVHLGFLDRCSVPQRLESSAASCQSLR